MTEVVYAQPKSGALIPPYDELGYELFVRSSWGSVDGEPMTYSGPEANALMAHMENWLPTVVDGEIHTESEANNVVDAKTGQKIRSFEVLQTWGEIDTREIIDAGISFEVAGPSRRLIDENIVPDITPDFVTNITEQSSGEIAMFVDAQGLPVRPNSLGSVHVSFLMGANGEYNEEPNLLRRHAIEEAWKALHDGGYLVWDGGTLGDFTTIMQLGFVPRKLETWILMEQDYDESAPDTGYRDAGMAINGVYQKMSHQGH